MKLEACIWQDGIGSEAIGMAKRLGSVEKSGRLDDLLLSVVDETVKQVFKDAGAKVIYDFLENNSHLKRDLHVDDESLFLQVAKQCLEMQSNFKWTLHHLLIMQYSD